MNDLVDEVVKLIGETFPRMINIATHVTPLLPPIAADGNQLHQVLLNLCVNARDAMPKGGTLTLTTGRLHGHEVKAKHHGAGEAEYVVLTVADTGTGMDEKTLEKIYEPFFTTKDIGKGSGLGLSTVFGIVQHHHGFLDVSSVPDKGTAFSIFLPVGLDMAGKEQPAMSTTPERQGTSGTILLVEDEDALRLLVETVLERIGYDVLTATDGIEAVEIFRKEHAKINLVVCDMGLPKLDGRGAFLQMKTIDPSVKILFASGYIEARLKDELMRAGACAVLHKPYRPHALIGKVTEILTRLP